MIDSALDRVRSLTTVDIVTVLTIAFLLLFRVGWSESIVVMLCLVALVHPPLRLRGELWLGIGVLRIVSLGPIEWANVDNVAYLVTWWCLALGIALMLRDPAAALAVSARGLLGAVFLLAVFWKLASPDFPNGDFFTFSFVTDLRLQSMAHAAGVGDVVTPNRTAVLAMLEPGGAETLALSGTAAVQSLGQPLAIATVILEGLVALSVLVRSWFPDWFRTGLLAVFVLITYALAPIVSFGWIVLLLAIAQTRPDEDIARAVHVGLFVSLPVLAWVATLEAAALPAFVGMIAAALFAAHMRGADVVFRDGGILLATLALGQLLEAADAVDNATLLTLALGVLAVGGLRLARASSRPPDQAGMP